MSAKLTIQQLSVDNRDDFYRVHCAECEHDWCFCAGWWTKNWDHFEERSAEENRKLRDQLIADGVSDGYLLYENGEPVGWVQAASRDIFEKLCKQFRLRAQRGAAAITCWFLIPRVRRKGYAKRFLELVLDDLKERGYTVVDAFPVKFEEKIEAGDLWTGPLSLYFHAGFIIERNHEKFPVYRKFL
ncbi:MAG: GNAT family N-acetyltransferase [bacterium]|nr:GNAT family N-acetyltransferase [bacterium]